MIGGLWKSTSRVALFAAAGLMMGGLATSAQAADLGGDCCADLEERVAELEATTARKGNRKVSLTVSGQVNEMIMFWDDGFESNTYVVGNDYSQSRFRFTGEAKINSDWSAGYYIEIGIDTGGSQRVNQSDDDGRLGLNLRQSNWFLKSNTLGSIRVGQASPATDDIILADVEGGGVAAFQDTVLVAGGFSFRTPGGGFGPTIASFAPSLDTARRNIVRYDTPTFQGFRIAAAWGEDDFWDVALWMANTWGDFKVIFNIGYLEDTEGNGFGSVFALNADGFCCQGANFSEIKGSAGIMHTPTALFVDGAYVHREFDRAPVTGIQLDDFDYWYIRGGIAPRLTPLGKTVFFGEYANGDGAGVEVGTFSANQMDVWGAGVVQHIDAAAMELYLVYKNYDGSTRTNGIVTPLEDFDVVFSGARIKF